MRRLKPPEGALPGPALSEPELAAPAPRKGERTRGAVLDAALDFASRVGLEGLTIGALAERLGMSKSGLIAHFGSREDLQLAVLDRYAANFIDEVLRPSLAAARGLPRLQVMLERWLVHLARELEQGCLMISGAIEYDDRPGPMRDAVVRVIDGWRLELRRAIEQARDEGQLAPDVDADQFVFEVYGLMLSLHQDARLLRSPAAVGHARAGLARLIGAARIRATAKRGATARRVPTAKRGPPAKGRPAKHATQATPSTARSPATERRRPALRRIQGDA
jgi:AcrR family transcriptional regulator